MARLIVLFSEVDNVNNASYLFLKKGFHISIGVYQSSHYWCIPDEDWVLLSCASMQQFHQKRKCVLNKKRQGRLRELGGVGRRRGVGREENQRNV